MYKIYDKVLLKDGRIAIITDFFKDNHSCVFEIQTDGDDDLDLGTVDDIDKKILQYDYRQFLEGRQPQEKF